MLGNKLTLIIDVNFRLQYYLNVIFILTILLHLSRLNIALSLLPNNIYWKLELLSELCNKVQ